MKRTKNQTILLVLAIIQFVSGGFYALQGIMLNFARGSLSEEQLMAGFAEAGISEADMDVALITSKVIGYTMVIVGLLSVVIGILALRASRDASRAKTIRTVAIVLLVLNVFNLFGDRSINGILTLVLSGLMLYAADQTSKEYELSKRQESQQLL